MAAMMQSISAATSPAVLTRLPATNRSVSSQVTQCRSVFYVPSRQTGGLRVRCTAESEEPKEQPVAPSVNVNVPPTPPPQPKPKVSTKFSDVLAFSGPAPERINGRLAMIGFVAALAAEVGSGQDLFAQLSNGGAAAFLGTSMVLTAASLIPLFKGVSVESKSKGLMTSDAEMWNGRFAMLGLVALAFTEYVKGGAFV